MLSDMAIGDEVKNIFIFVSDSVRYESTSDRILSLGVSGRGIAPSTQTSSSFPSILTGQYPSTHCVWSFEDCLSNKPSLISACEEVGINSETIWTNLPPEQKPPFKMVNASRGDSKKLANLSPPFISIEHDKGGHLPYGYSFSKFDTPSFFKNKRPSMDDLPTLYRKSVKNAENRFLSRYDYLKDEGLLKDTLVIYLSDHGEAFGQPSNAGKIGHGKPITPDLVDIPIVFAGAGLPNKELSCLLSGVDIAPTALSAVNIEGQESTNGIDCWSNSPNERLVRSERWVNTSVPIFGNTDTYRASSVWDLNGGMVFQYGSRFIRLLSAILSDFVRAPWSYLHRNPSSGVQQLKGYEKYISNQIIYGDPKFNIETALSEVQPFRMSNNNGEAVNKEILRELGYIE